MKEYLSVAKIPFVENYKLVRGLDYYTHTTFEILSSLGKFIAPIKVKLLIESSITIIQGS